jgi:hypothetical protein
VVGTLGHRDHGGSDTKQLIKRIEEGIDRPNRIDLIDEVIETFGQQRRLPTVRTFNEALHPCPPQIARRIIAGRAFSRSQGQQRQSE